MLNKLLEEGSKKLWRQMAETFAMTVAATVAAGAGAAIWGAIENTIFGEEEDGEVTKGDAEDVADTPTEARRDESDAPDAEEGRDDSGGEGDAEAGD